MDDVDTTAAGVEALAIPPALLPRATDSELARRAAAAADLVAGYGASARLDGRFRLAVGDLAKAVAGLEGMRACGLAGAIADEALPRLAEVVTRVEQALERAVPELQVERRDTEPPEPPARRRRRSGSVTK